MVRWWSLSGLKTRLAQANNPGGQFGFAMAL
jgi:hypothetical protein